MSEFPDQIKPDCPEPIEVTAAVNMVSKKSDYKEVAQKLLSGDYVLVEDRFSTGMALLSELKKIVFKQKKKGDFVAYRDKRSEYYHASNRLLVPVQDNQVALKKSPDIGWLERLYPGQDEFLLTFPQIQGLNSSWQWYLTGIKYPGLKEKIHPFYGTYFPTRFDHLHLFGTWLRKYNGPKTSAIDMGTGCGVLAFQMLSRGFEHVVASDINPNAILSVMEYANKTEMKERLTVIKSDLFEALNQKSDLVVFNPPWLPAQKEIEGLDSAIYYEEALFERFFEQAGSSLYENGKLVLLFSNLAESVGITDKHPVKEELENHDRFKKVRLLKRKVKKSSKKTKRRDHRKNEFVELWELEKQMHA